MKRITFVLAVLVAATLTLASPAQARTSGGYWMMTADGQVHGFGGAEQLGSPFSITGRVKITPTPSGNGYWVLSRAGSVYEYGDADTFGTTPSLPYGEDYTTMAATPSGQGYWLFTSKGRVFRFGDAVHFGDMGGIPLNGPVLDAVATPTGRGYFMVGSDGGIFTFGDAVFRGSTGNLRLNKPVMSMAPDADGVGYWLVASDGGIFAFDAPFHGSMGRVRLNKPITGIVASPTGGGYLMVAEDGGVFSFGDVPFHGSLANNPPAHPVVSIAAIGDPGPPPVYEWQTVLDAFATTGQAQTQTFTVSGDNAMVVYLCRNNGTYSYGCSYEIKSYATGAFVDGFMSDAFTGDPRSHLVVLEPGTYYIEGNEYGDNTIWGVTVGDHRCVQNCEGTR